MSESATAGSPDARVLDDGGAAVVGEDSEELLRTRVAAAVTGHAGVLRLEPTLLGAVQSLGRGGGLDGIQLVARGRVVDLDVNVATRADHQARATALELHHQLTSLIAAHGWVAGSVEISVLRIDEAG